MRSAARLRARPIALCHVYMYVALISDIVLRHGMSNHSYTPDDAWAGVLLHLLVTRASKEPYILVGPGEVLKHMLAKQGS